MNHFEYLNRVTIEKQLAFPPEMLPKRSPSKI